jgi:hypothetical protein
MGDVLAAISAESKINEVGLGFDQTMAAICV